MKDLTGRVIGNAFHVWKELGGGFLERVYHNALAHYLALDGFMVESDKRVKVYLQDGYEVGHFVLDLLISGMLVVELKAASGNPEVFAAQTLCYLRATRLHLALLINFSPTGPQVKRVVNDLDERPMPKFEPIS